MNKKSTPPVYEQTLAYAQSDDIPLLQSYLEKCMQATRENMGDYRILRDQVFDRQYEPFRAEVEALAARSRVEKIIEAAAAGDLEKADKQYGYLLTAISPTASLYPKFDEKMSPVYGRLDEVLDRAEDTLRSGNAPLAITLYCVGQYLAPKSRATAEKRKLIKEKMREAFDSIRARNRVLEM